MKRLVAIMVVVLMAMAGSHAYSDEIRLIDLHSRSASEMIPILRPMLSPGGALNGSEYQLMIRTTPENLAQLEEIIAKLDSVPQQLLIHVSYSGDKRSQENEASVSGSYESGTIGINIGPDRSVQERGMEIRSQGEGGHAKAHVYGSIQENSSTRSHRVRALEGKWTLIQAGQSVPYSSRTVIQTPNGPRIQQITKYKDVTSGFEVRPRISGNRVTLDIRPFYNRLTNRTRGNIDTTEITTTVSGRLGEWIEIGSLGESEKQYSQGIVSSRDQQKRDRQRVYLKVESLN